MSSITNSPPASRATCFFDKGELAAIDVMRYGVVSIDEQEPIHKAVSLLLKNKISGLPVTHAERLVGVLSDKDLLELLYETSYLPGTVADYMTRKVVSFDVGDRLSDISSKLIESSFRRVPVLQGQIIAGIITRTDLIGFYRKNVHNTGTTRADTTQTNARVEDAMKCGILTALPDMRLEEAMDVLVKHHITGLPVIDKEMVLLGIITEKDLLRHICNPQSEGALVEDLMTREVITFHPKDSLEMACACLIEHDFHRIPIVDPERLVGILSRSDVIKHCASGLK